MAEDGTNRHKVFLDFHLLFADLKLACALVESATSRPHEYALCPEGRPVHHIVSKQGARSLPLQSPSCSEQAPEGPAEHVFVGRDEPPIDGGEAAFGAPDMYHGDDYGGGGGIESFLPPLQQDHSPSQQQGFAAAPPDVAPGTDVSIER